MDVSVIVPNRNGRDLTPECLASVPAGIETIVVDNGSTDGSADEIAARFPWVMVIRNPVNRGFAAAANQGMARATGRFFCLLNSDARLMPGALDAMFAFMTERPDVGVLTPQLVHQNGRRQHSFAPLPSPATELLNKSLLRFLFPEDFPSASRDYLEPRDVPSVVGACMMIRRSLVERIGGFDEAFFLFLEETDFCLRARKAGARVVFLPWARAIHLQGMTRQEVAIRAKIEYVRSLFTYFRKNRPRSYPLLRLAYPFKNLVELLTLLPALPFSRRARRRWSESASVLAWQAAGTPRSWGLSSSADPKYELVRTGRGRTWVAEEAADLFRDFDRAVASRRVLKDLRLKKTEECRAGDRTFLVKTYREGGWRRRLKRVLFGSMAALELKRCGIVRRLGIPTVPVQAAGERQYESWVAFEKLPGAQTLQQALLADADDPKRRWELLFRYGKFARRLHDAGITQYDFNPTNVLLDRGEMRLIDFEKLKVYGGPVPRRARLRALAKMNRIPRLTRTDRLRFLNGYLHAHVAERLMWKETVAEIARLWARQVAADEARAERRCVRENRDFSRFSAPGWDGYYRKIRPESPVAGVTPEDLLGLAEGRAGSGRFGVREAGDALAEWKRANREALRGGAAPIAVIFKKGRREGIVVYPAGGE